MEISRNIIIDLLPLYLADEASEETRELVESYLAQDRSLQKIVQEARGEQVIEKIPVSLQKETELITLEKMKRYTRQRDLFMAISFLFTGLLLAFRSDGGGVSWFWNGTSAAWPVFVLASGSWILFTNAAYKLSTMEPQEWKMQRNTFFGLGMMCTTLFFLLLIFANLGPLDQGLLYFLFFFATVGWIGFANARWRLKKF